jgi:hypothetical protein
MRFSKHDTGRSFSKFLLSLFSASFISSFFWLVTRFCPPRLRPGVNHVLTVHGSAFFLCLLLLLFATCLVFDVWDVCRYDKSFFLL